HRDRRDGPPQPFPDLPERLKLPLGGQISINLAELLVGKRSAPRLQQNRETRRELEVLKIPVEAIQIGWPPRRLSGEETRDHWQDSLRVFCTSDGEELEHLGPDIVP